MNGRSLADDLVDEISDDDRTAAGDIETNKQAAPVRDQLSVRQIAVGLDVARELASRAAGHDGDGWLLNGNDRRSAAQSGTDGRGPVVRQESLREESPTEPHGAHQSSTTTHPRQWVPDHDGPVFLSGVAAPRARTARRSVATPDSRPRQTAPRRRRSDRPVKSAQIDFVAAELAARPPRLVVIPACGGAGATTTAVLLAAAFAPAAGVLLVAGGVDRAALTTSADASGGDVDALASWLVEHPGGPLESETPGMATGNAGTGQLVVAAAGYDDLGHAFNPGTAVDLFAAATTTHAAVLLDWCSAEPPPARVWDSATHVVVTAPSTAPGLLAAECRVRDLQLVAPEDVPLSLIKIDIRGRSQRRAGRAPLARLRALNLPVASLPHDAALANDPRVDWAALRPRTRSAVVAALTNIQHPDQPRKDHR